jgi:hypothetical protein
MHEQSTTRHWNTAWVIGMVMLVAYGGVRVYSAIQTLPEIRMATDSPVFLDMALRPVLSKAFLAGQRPFTVPLMYKLVGASPMAVGILQAGLSMLAWTLLAVQVARSMHGFWVKVAGFGLVLTFSLSSGVMGWDTVIMSESISLSLMVLLVAGWLWLLEAWHWSKVVLLVVITFFWAFSRETNAYVVLMIAAILSGAALVQPSCRRYLWIAVFFVTFFVANQVSSNVGRRWEFPFLNVLAQRILPSPIVKAYFRLAGMPVTPQLEDMADQWASSHGGAFYNDPNLAEFRQWFRSRGRLTYLQWFLCRPCPFLVEPIVEMGEMFGSSGYGYFSVRFTRSLPESIEGVVYPREATPFLWWLAAIAAGAVIGAKAWRSSPLWAVPLTLILLMYPHAFLVWHGDAMEVGRHAVQAGIQFHLGLWLLGLLALDYHLTSSGLSGCDRIRDVDRTQGPGGGDEGRPGAGLSLNGSLGSPMKENGHEE